MLENSSTSGFWARVGAAMIDTLLLLVICAPLVTLVYGRTYWTSDAFLQGPADFLINWLLPAIAVIVFWTYRQATPGKIAIAARIVDAETGGKPSTRQLDRAVPRLLRFDAAADGRHRLGRLRSA